MGFHGVLKEVLSAGLSGVTGGVFEVSLPFDSRDQSFRVSTPCVVFQLGNFAEAPAGSGVFRTELTVNVLGSLSECERIGEELFGLFSAVLVHGGFEVSLVPRASADVFEADLGCRRVEHRFDGVVIKKGV